MEGKVSKIHRTLMPVTRPHDKDQVILIEHFNYTCPQYGIKVIIRKGFIFDGASIPRIFWSTTGSPFLPQYIGPGLIHDYLYRRGRQYMDVAVTRKTADKVLENALRMNRVSGYQRFKMFRGVRAMGWIPWNKHRKRQK